MSRDWMFEDPEPVLAQTMATEAAIARREAADEPHPLTCRCHECADYDFLLDPLRDFDTDEGAVVSVLTPLFTECPSHPDWQVDCDGDETRKARLEAAHAQRYHCGIVTSEAVADLLYGDPKNQRDRDVVEECIREDAATHNRHVDQNRVRELIPAWVNPRLVGSVYSVLLRRGVLVPDGETRSTDRKGRNAGKRFATYLYRGAL